MRLALSHLRSQVLESARGSVIGLQPRVRTDAELDGIEVAMPEVISAESVDAVRTHLAQPMTRLLIDTNRHAFESLACIRAFREVLEGARLAERGVKVAFVVPREHRAPEVVSAQEGYFDDVTTARTWLMRSIDSREPT